MLKSQIVRLERPILFPIEAEEHVEPVAKAPESDAPILKTSKSTEAQPSKSMEAQPTKPVASTDNFSSF